MKPAVPIPEGMAMELRIALMRKGKSLRAFARDSGLPIQTVHHVVRGERSRGPAWERVMRAALPLLPAKMAAQIRPQLAAMDALREQRLPEWASFAQRGENSGTKTSGAKKARRAR